MKTNFPAQGFRVPLAVSDPYIMGPTKHVARDNYYLNLDHPPEIGPGAYYN